MIKKRNIYTIQMNVISRIRSDDGEWNYYTDEDIIDGIIVFEGVKEVICEIDPFKLNDEIYDIQSKEIAAGLYEFIIYGNYVVGLNHKEGNIKIIATNIYLCDPKNPSLKVTE